MVNFFEIVLTKVIKKSTISIVRKNKRGCGGIGRRAGLRNQCQRRGGSSPFIRTKQEAFCLFFCCSLNFERVCECLLNRHFFEILIFRLSQTFSEFFSLGLHFGLQILRFFVETEMETKTRLFSAISMVCKIGNFQF